LKFFQNNIFLKTINSNEKVHLNEIDSEDSNNQNDNFSENFISNEINSENINLNEDNENSNIFYQSILNENEEQLFNSTFELDVRIEENQFDKNNIKNSIKNDLEGKYSNILKEKDDIINDLKNEIVKLKNSMKNNIYNIFFLFNDLIVFKDLEIKNLISSGSYGNVYLGLYQKKNIAIKEISLKLIKNENFFNEILILK
jgi:hypothetical protein